MPIDIELEQVHRFTLDQYHQLIESGGLDEESRVELIDGWLLTMASKTPEHEGAIMWLNMCLARGVDPAVHRVGVGTPVTTGRSEPEPDLTVTRVDVQRPYHAATADLVIEVCWSSRHRDLVLKPRVYAGAGVPDYWVVDLHARCVMVHRRPGPDGYGAITEQRTGVLVPVAGGLPTVDLDQLFRAAGV